MKIMLMLKLDWIITHTFSVWKRWDKMDVDIMFWIHFRVHCILSLISRYDPNADIPVDTDSEQDRVIFIKSVAQFMVSFSTWTSKLSVKFN